jgi:hypothetical protein
LNFGFGGDLRARPALGFARLLVFTGVFTAFGFAFALALDFAAVFRFALVAMSSSPACGAAGVSGGFRTAVW